MKRALTLPALLAGMLVLAACGSDKDSTTATTAEGSASCEEVDAPAPKDLQLKAPTAKAPTASSIVFDTSCGSFTVELDAESMPKTAASFQYLAEQGAYDDTTYHRVAPGFVIQGGDPLGDGTGGPGYSVTEPVPGDTVYSTGLVAMAKSGAEPPGTSGSQFFVVTAPADAGLPPDYAVVGEVTEGFETVEAIEALADPAVPDGAPTQTVITESTTVEE
jgi:peptidyl-prolyl cis-trans isomerase B (cyclophilin B)